MQKTTSSRWQSLRPSLAWIAAAILAAWAVNIFWWALLSPESREQGETRSIEIALGTADAIANGRSLTFLPSEYSFPKGGTLLVHNLDNVEHRIGDWVIPPGGTAELTESDQGSLTCTIHPSGYIGISLTERPPFISTVGLAFLLGFPIGILLAVSIGVLSRLDDGGDGASGHPLVA